MSTNAVADEKPISLGESFRILFAASRAFWLVNLVNFGDGIAYFGILNLLTLYVHGTVGFSDPATGWAVSFFTGLVTLGMIGGGFVSDRLGVRRALTASLAALVLGRLLLVLAPGMSWAVPLLWAGLLVMGIAEGVIQPALYAGVKEFTDPRTATIGYSILYAIMNLGIFAEQMISPYIRVGSGRPEAHWHGVGITGVYWAMLGMTVIMLALNLLLFTRKVEEKDRVLAYVARPSGDRRSVWQRLRALPVLDSRFLFFIFILLPVRTLFAHQWMTMPDYITRCFPPAVSNRYEWFQAINPLIIVVAVPLIASLTRRVNVITMMILGTLVSAASTALLLPSPNVGLLVTYMLLFSIGEAMWASRFLEYVSELAPAGQVGAYMGIAGLPWFLAKFTTGFYSGSMIATFIPEHGVQDPSRMWLIYGCIAMLSPIGLLIGRRWVQRGVRAPA